jgi:hypothetical protein
MATSMRWFVIGAIAALTAACATAPAPPTVDVTGTWAGTWTYTNAALGGGQAELKLKQSGSDFNGDMTVSGAAVNRTGFIQGTVSGNEVRIIAPPGLTGVLTVTGDEAKGLLHGISDGNVTLRRRR